MYVQHAFIAHPVVDIQMSRSRLRYTLGLCGQLVGQTRRLSETPDEGMLKRLRVLERKMGLVLTLVRPSSLFRRVRVTEGDDSCG